MEIVQMLFEEQTYSLVRIPTISRYDIHLMLHDADHCLLLSRCVTDNSRDQSRCPTAFGVVLYVHLLYHGGDGTVLWPGSIHCMVGYCSEFHYEFIRETASICDPSYFPKNQTAQNGLHENEKGKFCIHVTTAQHIS